MLNTVSKGNRGFTLIELLVVIAIIAILASLSIPQYLSYQRKARVSSYAEPIARGCIMDLAAYCMENPNSDKTVFLISDPKGIFENCVNRQTSGGAIKLDRANVTCDASGTLTSGTVTATIDGISDYKAVCTIQNGGFKCTITN